MAPSCLCKEGVFPPEPRAAWCFGATVLPMFPLLQCLCAPNVLNSAVPVESCGSVSLLLSRDTKAEEVPSSLVLWGRDILCWLLSTLVSSPPFLQPYQFCVDPQKVALVYFFLCCWLDSFDFSSKGSGNLLPQSRLTVRFTCTSTETVVTAEEAVNFSFQLTHALCKSLWPLLSQGSHFPTPTGVQNLGCFNKL